MPEFRSKLPRYTVITCQQVMPVPVVPACSFPTSVPTIICQYASPCYTVLQSTTCIPSTITITPFCQ